MFRVTATELLTPRVSFDSGDQRCGARGGGCIECRAAASHRAACAEPPPTKTPLTCASCSPPSLPAPDPSLLSYLRDAISPTGTGRGLHFAYHSDLTLSAQRLADALAAPGAEGRAPCRRADRAYFWNRALAKPAMGAPRAARWEGGRGGKEEWSGCRAVGGDGLLRCAAAPWACAHAAPRPVRC